MIGYRMPESGTRIERFPPFVEDPTAAVIVEPSGEILACNRSFIRVFGYDSIGSALGSDLAGLFPDLRCHTWRREVEVSSGECISTSGKRRDGTPIVVSIEAFPSLDEDGAVSCVRAYFRGQDGSLLHDAEPTIRAAGDRLPPAASRQPRDVAHDVSNIVTAITFHADTLAARLDQDDLRERALAIGEAAQEAGAMISQLASLASAQVWVPETLSALTGCETILIVEDDPALRELMLEALAARGYCGHTAATGSEASEIFERIQDDVDLLVVDVVLADIRGPDLVDMLLSKRGGLRVLFISGYLSVPEDLTALASDNAFLKKPFDSNSLCRHVREVLDRPPR